MIERLDNWPARLNRVIEASRHLPFTWESQNCCLFAANVVEAITGVDIATGYRKKATSRVAVRRLVKQSGGVAYLAMKVLEANGIHPVPVPQAKRGDVVLAMTEQGHAGGICLGEVCAFPGPSGLVFIPTANCTHAFAV